MTLRLEVVTCLTSRQIIPGVYFLVRAYMYRLSRRRKAGGSSAKDSIVFAYVFLLWCALLID